MTTEIAATVDFVELQVEDFRQFRGRQSFAFARPPVGVGSALTVLIGAGASGKTNLSQAMRMALWGARRVYAMRTYVCLPQRSYGNPFLTPTLFINADALQGPQPTARVRLTLSVESRGSAPTTIAVTRSWVLAEAGRVREEVRAAVRAAGRAEYLERQAAQRRISELLPPGRLPHLFSDREQACIIGRLASLRPPVSELAEQELDAITGGFSREAWRGLAPEVIGVANRLLSSYGENDDLWLLPEEGGRHWKGAYPIVPGVWVTREPEGSLHSDCIGHALSVGLHLAGATRAPLVLDDPAVWMRPGYTGSLLEGLSRARSAQMVVTALEGEVDELVLSLWGRVQVVHLAQGETGAARMFSGERARGGWTR